MEKKEISKRAKAEAKKLRSLLFSYDVDENQIKLLTPLIENTAWMKVKLDDAMESIKESQIVVAYDNGGGQKGIRENPLFKGYEALFKSYMTALSKVLEYVPKQEAVKQIEPAKEQSKTVLEFVRCKKNA